MEAGEKHAESCRGLSQAQKTKPRTNPAAEVSIAEHALKAFEATDVTDAQDLRLPEAASHDDSEPAIVIDDPDDGGPQEPNSEGGAAFKPAKRARKRRIPYKKSTSGGDAVAMSADSTQTPLVSSPKLRSSQRTINSPNETSKAGAFKRTKPQEPAVKSKPIPPITEDIVNERTSTGWIAQTATRSQTTESNELQSSFPRSRSKPVTAQLDRTRGVVAGKSSTSSEVLRSLLTNIFGRSENGC